MISRDKETFFSVCIFVVVIIPYSDLGLSKKTEKSSKPRKKNQKNRTEKKNPIKPIIFFVKIFGSVRFRFPKPETGKTPTEPNRFDLRGTINRKKKHVLISKT
jgi:hypothetical protein